MFGVGVLTRGRSAFVIALFKSDNQRRRLIGGKRLGSTLASLRAGTADRVFIPLEHSARLQRGECATNGATLSEVKEFHAVLAQHHHRPTTGVAPGAPNPIS